VAVDLVVTEEVEMLAAAEALVDLELVLDLQ
jgi:hypothetical protein